MASSASGSIAITAITLLPKWNFEAQSPSLPALRSGGAGILSRLRVSTGTDDIFGTWRDEGSGSRLIAELPPQSSTTPITDECPRNDDSRRRPESEVST